MDLLPLMTAAKAGIFAENRIGSWVFFHQWMPSNASLSCGWLSPRCQVPFTPLCIPSLKGKDQKVRPGSDPKGILLSQNKGWDMAVSLCERLSLGLILVDTALTLKPWWKTSNNADGAKNATAPITVSCQSLGLRSCPGSDYGRDLGTGAGTEGPARHRTQGLIPLQTHYGEWDGIHWQQAIKGLLASISHKDQREEIKGRSPLLLYSCNQALIWHSFLCSIVFIVGLCRLCGAVSLGWKMQQKSSLAGDAFNKQ